MDRKTFYYHFKKRKWFVIRPSTTSPGANISATEPASTPPTVAPVIQPQAALAPAMSPPQQQTQQPQPHPRVCFPTEQRDQLIADVNTSLQQTLSQWF